MTNIIRADRHRIHGPTESPLQHVAAAGSIFYFSHEAYRSTVRDPDPGRALREMHL